MKPSVFVSLASLIFAAGLVLLAPADMASAEDAADHNANIANIRAQLENILQIEEVRPVGETGFYRLRLSDGSMVFTDSKAKGFFVGEVFSYSSGRFVNSSEAMLNDERFAAVQKVPVSDMVVFPAKGKKIGELYVFTDIDCGYCRRFHDEIELHQKNGIEVRYLAWPRCGIGAQCDSYTKAVSVWCAENQQQAMTIAKAGRRPAKAECDNPVAKQFELGRRLGLRGTPYIMLSNGTAIPGYMAASKIAEMF